MGPEIAEPVAASSPIQPTGGRVCRRLQAAWLLTEESVARAAPGPLAGKTFVRVSASTGRPARGMIERLRGPIAGLVSRRTDYLVVGGAPGHKLQAARRLRVATPDGALRRLVDAWIPASMRGAHAHGETGGTRRPEARGRRRVAPGQRTRLAGRLLFHAEGWEAHLVVPTGESAMVEAVRDSWVIVAGIVVLIVAFVVWLAAGR